MILVIGEALIDLIAQPNNPTEFRAVVGGANANVAVALAQQNAQQRFLGRISNDGFGTLISRHLEAKGVNTDLCISTSDPTTLAIANIDAAGIANYSFYIKGTADWGWMLHELPTEDSIMDLGAKALQFGCLTMAIQPGRDVVLDWISRLRNKLTLSHDLNLRPALGFERSAELTRVLRINQASDIIKASDADLEWLFSLPRGSDLDSICHEWSADSRLVVLTRGESGASCYFSGDRVDVPGIPVSLQDTVGAGDTFMATMLVSLNELDALGQSPRSRLQNLNRNELESVLRRAVVAAGIACERVGCQPPSREELDQRLN